METIIHRDGNEETFLVTIPSALDPGLYQELLSCLNSLKSEYRKGYTNSGAEVPREQLWLHNENKYFCDSWVSRFPRWEANPYPEAILRTQSIIQQKLAEVKVKVKVPCINSCLLNYYRDGNSCIHPHRDNKSSFGERPTIVGLSIGATRKLVLRHSFKDDVKYVLELKDNSLFIMAGASQLNFLHGIPCETECTAERWSLTFREHL
jgi:alkylated DNA repair dioxygenase AlkB